MSEINMELVIANKDNFTTLLTDLAAINIRNHHNVDLLPEQLHLLNRLSKVMHFIYPESKLPDTSINQFINLNNNFVNSSQSSYNRPITPDPEGDQHLLSVCNAYDDALNKVCLTQWMEVSEAD